MLANFNFEKVIQTDLEILHRIRNLQFLPVWKCTDISHQGMISKKSLDRRVQFSEAQFNENQNCCCTSSWIHMYSFHFPVSSLVEMFG